MRSDLPHLSVLFAAYFHEDFDVVGDWPEVVDRFVDRSPDPVRIRGAIEEAASILARPELADADIDEIMQECGSTYHVEPGQARTFLEGIHDRLISGLTRLSASTDT